MNCTENKLKKIAIVQFIDHPMLDSCRKGFLDGLKKLGYQEGKNIILDYQNAQGDMSLNNNIASKFGKGNYDVIFSIATPTSQALKQATELTQIPVIFAAVTDPVSLGLVKSLESSGNNFTGTSDARPYYDQLHLITLILPSAKKIGIIYNSYDANTQYAMKQVRTSANLLGLSLIESPITNTNEVRLGARIIANQLDCYFIIADSTTMSAAPIIIKTGNESNKPVFAGDPETFDLGCLAGIGISYYNLGLANAEMVHKIIADRLKPSQIPIVVSPNPELMINLKIAEKHNLHIPDSLIALAERIVK
jgi:putative tryptophan/tyrosine transport system substrate-binding protein